MVHEHPLTVQQVQTHISRVNSSCCADLYLLKWSQHTFNCYHIRVKISVPSGGCWLFLNDRYFYSVYLRYRLVTVLLSLDEIKQLKLLHSVTGSGSVVSLIFQVQVFLLLQRKSRHQFLVE